VLGLYEGSREKAARAAGAPRCFFMSELKLRPPKIPKAHTSTVACTLVTHDKTPETDLMPIATAKVRWWSPAVYVLPSIHLLACIVITVSGRLTAWQHLIPIDFPVSIVAMSFVWRYEDPSQVWYHPLLWFGVLGTLWWYVVSRAFEIWGTKLVAAIRTRRSAHSRVD
jgi:hypothetical protein